MPLPCGSCPLALSRLRPGAHVPLRTSPGVTYKASDVELLMRSVVQRQHLVELLGQSLEECVDIIKHIRTLRIAGLAWSTPRTVQHIHHRFYIIRIF